MTCWKVQILFMIVINVGLGAAQTNGEENVPRACPPNYEYYSKGHKCYKVSDEPRRWFRARDQCRQEGANLVVINDSDTENFVSNLVYEKSGQDEKRFWIGLKEIRHSRTFKWVDGNPLEYANWQVLEPYNDNGDNIDCVESMSRYEPNIANWNDIGCMVENIYVCEKSLMVHPACPSRYTSYSQNRKCVRAVHDGRLNWDEARRFCQGEGGDLVMIKDDSYNTFVKSLLKEGEYYWIGLDGFPTPGFQWIDGSPLEYTHWMENEPDDPRNPEYRCVISIVSGSAVWNDVRYVDRNSAVCEQDFYVAESCRDEDWVLNTGNKMCYKIQTGNKIFHEAKVSCQQEGGDLAVISDDRSLDYFKDFITKFESQSYYWYTNVTTTSINGICHVFRTEYPRRPVDRCDTPLPSLCERPTVRDGAVLECPDGYTTYVTTTTGWIISCLMADNTHQKTMEKASFACQEVGGDLYPNQPSEFDRNEFVHYSLMVYGNLYWFKSNCKRYDVANRNIIDSPCNVPEFYVCKHWGNIKEKIQLRNVPDMIGQHVYNPTNPGQSMTLVEICRTLNTNTTQNHPAWMQTATEVTVAMNRSWSGVISEKQNTRCLYHQQRDCCTEATFNRPADWTDMFQMKTTFSQDIIHCLCTTPVTEKTIGLLKNLTTPSQNSSSPPQNKLCPCPCRSVGINFNPSPKELTQILSKIKKELKVDIVVLSSKRNKKLSASDTRTESSVIGYFGVVLCLIPVCLLVAVDIIRIVQYIQGNNTVHIANTQ